LLACDSGVQVCSKIGLSKPQKSKSQQAGGQMSYAVTYGAKPTVDEMPTLEAALEHAGQLVSDNYANVAIEDGRGNEISGDDLIACYLGVMKLTPDLRAIAT
jgi:hypothetical protein